MDSRRRAGISWVFQLSCLFVVLICVIVVSTGMGYIRIPPGKVIHIILGYLFHDSNTILKADSVFPYVVVDVRLPRILTSAVVGAGLALSGAVFQGILLNPLADPYTLGISAGAAFGAAVALVFDISVFGVYSVTVFAFAGAISTLFAVMLIAASEGQTSSNNLILSGVIVAAILSAGIGFMKFIADEQVSIIIFWLMGSFASRTWTDVILAFSSVLAGFLVCMYYSRDLNIISLGSRSADSLGVESNKVRRILLITASLVTAICVSVSGIIGFVGLIIPHLARLVVGPDNRVLLPASALGGAILLCGADTITRAVLPREVPIGILTALIGGPFFCYVFRTRKLTR